MEYFNMNYAIFLLLSLAVVFSEAKILIHFQSQTPNVVLVGDNLTLNWTYSTGPTPPPVIDFGIPNSSATGDAFKKIARYHLEPLLLNDVKPGPYCDNITWLGNTTRNIVTFNMINITEFSHETLFTIQIMDGVTSKYKQDLDKKKLFISVRPKVQLRVSNTNNTAGDRVTIQCQTIKGRPTPTISWYLDGKKLVGKTGNYFLRNSEIEEKDKGAYNCVGENNAGSDTSDVVSVAVHKKPGTDDGNETPIILKRSTGLSGVAIAGIIIGVLLGILIVVAVIFILYRRKGNSASNRANTAERGDETKMAMVQQQSNKEPVWL